MKLMKKQKQQEEEDQAQVMNNETLYLKKKSIKELIAPSGIDASNIDHLEIISKDMLEVFMFLHYQEHVYSQNYLDLFICLAI